mgnify:FL=1|tara:strand:+ start:54 stop:473 length:420 start_codon:yes stop_codon:yes gene_type:complete
MSYYDDIRAALEVALNGIAGIPAIAWENKRYAPVTGTPYILVRNLPTSRRPAVRGLNPQMRYQGVFQLLVKFPEGAGPGPSEDLTETLLETFEATTDLSFTNTDAQTVYVTIDYAEQVGAYTESPWYTTPINIGYYSYK